MQKKTIKHFFLIRAFISVFIAFIFVYFASYSTSSLYPLCFGADSAQFQTIGRAWLNGLVPYVDIFDHKGPFIFFVNLLGYYIHDSRSGVFFVQLIFMSFTVYGLSLLATLYSKKISYSIFVTVSSLLLIANSYQGGNFTEEYCLPFLIFTTYFQLLYFLNKDYEYKLAYSFFCGIAFSVCFLTRLTNLVTIFCGFFCIIADILLNKRYKFALKHLLVTSVGFFIPVSLFSIYFLLNDAFYDFIFGTLIFNFSYKINIVPWINRLDSYEHIADFIFYCFSYYSLLLTILLALRFEKIIICLYFILVFAFETYLFFTTSLYLHYTLICLPQVVIFFNIVFKVFLDNVSVRRLPSSFCLIISFLLLAHNILYDFNNFTKVYRKSISKEIVNQIKDIKSLTDDDNIILYTDNNFREFYLVLKILPIYKYFMLQEWNAKFSEKVKNEIYNCFKTCKVKWIFLSGNSSIISNILEDKYILVSEKYNGRLYRRKEF